MKVSFISNYFNHHQKFFSDEMFQNLNGNYCFIETTEMSEERKKMGYANYKECYLKKNIPNLFEKYLFESDVIIVGSCMENLTQQCVKKNKIVFRYSERPVREERKIRILKYIPRLIKWNILNLKSKPIYLLCASAYTRADYKKYFLFQDKAYKWGYFPETKHYDIVELLNKKKTHKILWCGRFIECKHPEVTIEIAKRLKSEGMIFEIDLIGNGQLENKIFEMIKSNELEDCVKLLGGMSSEKVRKYMEEAGVFLFTSDFYEGWGAVLNESMNSGCAVVASHAIGAAPFLINHKQNGLIYENGNLDDLYNKVKMLIDNPDMQKKMGKAAYETIVNTWNAEVAAKRFLNLVDEIKKYGYCELYEDGPCSKAPILKDNWFKGEY